MVMRLTGLSSGMDTDTLIQSIIETEKIPIYRLQAENDFNQDKMSAWSDVDSKISSLKSAVTSLTSYSTWKQVNANSSSESVVTATAGSSALNADYEINVTKLAQAHRVRGEEGLAVPADIGAGSFVLGGAAITLDGTETSMEDIATKINNESANMTDEVKAMVIDGTLVLERVNTGATEISYTDTDGILGKLGFFTDDLGAPTAGFGKVSVVAQDLEATISGVAVSRSENSNITDVISGVTLNFESTGTSTLSVERDTESIKEKINEFIDAYNETMSFLEEYTQVNLGAGGENIESTGILQGESSLRTIMNTSRTMITSSDSDLADGFEALRHIGISTSGEENRLSITDSAALDDALKNNITEVEDLFRDYDNGILKKFQNQLDTWTDPSTGTVSIRKDSLQSSIDSNNDKISDLEARIELYETSLYDQFARMEEAMAQMDSQQKYISQLFSGLSSDDDS